MVQVSRIDPIELPSDLFLKIQVEFEPCQLAFAAPALIHPPAVIAPCARGPLTLSLAVPKEPASASPPLFTPP